MWHKYLYIGCPNIENSLNLIYYGEISTSDVKNTLCVDAMSLKILFISFIWYQIWKRGKIAPGIFIIIHFNSEKKNRTYPTTYPGRRLRFQNWEVGGLQQFHDFIIWIFWKYWTICSQKLSVSNIAKKPMKIACFHDFLPKSQLFPIFLTQNANFSIFEGVLTLWRHSDIIH